MFIRAKYVLQFSRRDDLQNTGFDPPIENRTIVWTFIFEAAEIILLFWTLLHMIFVELLSSKPSKNSASLRILSESKEK